MTNISNIFFATVFLSFATFTGESAIAAAAEEEAHNLEKTNAVAQFQILKEDADIVANRLGKRVDILREGQLQGKSVDYRNDEELNKLTAEYNALLQLIENAEQKCIDLGMQPVYGPWPDDYEIVSYSR